MESIERRLLAALLAVIRARRQAPTSSGGAPLGAATGNVAPAKVREAHFSDFESVAALKQRWGLAADSIENWERLWKNNPAFAQAGLKRPIGWVLEAQGKVVGYLGNIAQLYRYGEKTLVSVTAHGLVVEPPYRALGVSLVAAYFRQSEIDLFVSTGEIAPVGKIGRAFKSEPLPHEDYESVLFWVLRPRPFVQALLKELRIGPTLSAIGGTLASLFVRADRFLRRRCPHGASGDFTVTEMGIGDLGEAFQQLWIEKVNEKTTLIADRRPAMLRWHFEVPGDRGSVRLLGCSKNGKLLGYAVVRNEPADETGLRRSTIADMIAKDGDPAIMQTLLAASYRHAERAGSHILEVLGFPPSVRRIWADGRPYVRKYPTPLFAFKATDPILHKALSYAETWYASPFDGDLTLIRPSYCDSRDGIESRRLLVDASDDCESRSDGNRTSSSTPENLTVH